ncbi:MAG: hypothetical protein RR598_10665 [Anaerorhabdus sp.]
MTLLIRDAMTERLMFLAIQMENFIFVLILICLLKTEDKKNK